MNSILLDHSLTHASETSLLQGILDKIHGRYIPAHPTLTIRWGIPGATVIKRTITQPEDVLSEHDRTLLNRGKSLIVLGRWNQAATLIKPLADAGLPEAQCLIAHALRRSGGNWEAYAKRYAERSHHVQLVPASSHDRQRREIVLHSYLYHRKAPQFVLTYLIYHECIQSMHPRGTDGFYSEIFLAAEKHAPHREKAIRWLCRHGFPVMQL